MANIRHGMIPPLAKRLEPFVRPAGFVYPVEIQARGTFAFDSARNMIVQSEEARDWLDAGNLTGAWDSVLEPVDVSPLTSLDRMTKFNLIMSFEHEEDALLYRLRWK
jgi:hypothetical protein